MIKMCSQILTVIYYGNMLGHYRVVVSADASEAAYGGPLKLYTISSVMPMFITCF